MSKYKILKNFALAILLLLFLFLAPSGAISIPIGLIVIFINSRFLLSQSLREVRYLPTTAHLVSLCLVLSFFIFPQSHGGYLYDEEGNKVLKKHGHYLWQKNHIH